MKQKKEKKKPTKPRVSKVKKKQKEYLGFPVDSDGEIHFIMWMEELKQNNYIIDYKRGDSVLLSNSLSNNYVTQLKTKSKPCRQNVLMGHSYNWDFTIEWSDIGIKHFVNKFGEKWEKPFLINSKNMSFIECKPPFDFQNMTRLSVLNIKWVWDKYQIFVQTIKNVELFEKTFTPKVYLTTKNGSQRKTKHKIKTLQEYLDNNKTKENETTKNITI